MIEEKYGFVYIWFDRKYKRYYIGCHWGTVDDGYICSSKWMKISQQRRPQDFKRRVLQTNILNRASMLEEEYRWLSFIKDEELGKKYYNMSNRHFAHWSTDPNSIKTIKQKLSEATKKLFEDPEYRKRYMEGRKKMPPHTPEQIRKRSLANTGKKRSEETKAKIRESLTGEKNPLFGIPLSEEHRAKVSESLKGEKNHFYGKKHTEESKKLMSDKLKISMKGKMPKNIEWLKQTKCWTNGTINKRSIDCPGPEWRNGMVGKNKGITV